MDDYWTRSRFLSLTAFSAVAHCAHWIIANINMVLPDEGESKHKRLKASWSPAEEVAFLDYLVDHRSQATRGCFKGATIAAAIDSISHLHVKGMPKNKSTGMHKWNAVSNNFLSIIILSTNLYISTVQVCVQRNPGVQIDGLWCNLGRCSWCRHQ
jgi:hypothetical protein